MSTTQPLLHLANEADWNPLLKLIGRSVQVQNLDYLQDINIKKRITRK